MDTKLFNTVGKFCETFSKSNNDFILNAVRLCSPFMVVAVANNQVTIRNNIPNVNKTIFIRKV